MDEVLTDQVFIGSDSDTVQTIVLDFVWCLSQLAQLVELKPLFGDEEVVLPPSLNHSYVFVSADDHNLNSCERLLPKLKFAESNGIHIIIFAHNKYKTEDQVGQLIMKINQYFADGLMIDYVICRENDELGFLTNFDSWMEMVFKHYDTIPERSASKFAATLRKFELYSNIQFNDIFRIEAVKNCGSKLTREKMLVVSDSDNDFAHAHLIPNPKLIVCAVERLFERLKPGILDETEFQELWEHLINNVVHEAKKLGNEHTESFETAVNEGQSNISNMMAPRYLLSVLSDYVTSSMHQVKLKQLCSRSNEGTGEYYNYIYAPNRSMLDVLQDFLLFENFSKDRLLTVFAHMIALAPLNIPIKCQVTNSLNIQKVLAKAFVTHEPISSCHKNDRIISITMDRDAVIDRNHFCIAPISLLVARNPFKITESSLIFCDAHNIGLVNRAISAACENYEEMQLIIFGDEYAVDFFRRKRGDLCVLYNYSEMLRNNMSAAEIQDSKLECLTKCLKTSIPMLIAIATPSVERQIVSSLNQLKLIIFDT